MNKKLLCAALLCGMGVAHSAVAQEFDDRWYVSASTGVNFQDNDRGTEDAIFGTLGFGKFWTPNWSVDLELNYQNPDKSANPNLWWSQYGASVDARYHFRNADRKWWPYLLFGVVLSAPVFPPGDGRRGGTSHPPSGSRPSPLGRSPRTGGRRAGRSSGAGGRDRT